MHVHRPRMRMLCRRLRRETKMIYAFRDGTGPLERTVYEDESIAPIQAQRIGVKLQFQKRRGPGQATMRHQPHVLQKAMHSRCVHGMALASSVRELAGLCTTTCAQQGMLQPEKRLALHTPKACPCGVAPRTGPDVM